jgi:hypothetical protein
MKPEQRYNKAKVKFNGGNGACLCNQCRVILSYGFDHDDVARYCETCYNELYDFVRYVADDWIELSDEKVRVQRDDYIRMAKNLLEMLDNESKYR